MLALAPPTLRNLVMRRRRRRRRPLACARVFARICVRMRARECLNGNLHIFVVIYSDRSMISERSATTTRMPRERVWVCVGDI